MTAATELDQTIVSQPIPDLVGDGLLGTFADGPRLVGTRCDSCGCTMIGARIVCSTCVSTDVTRTALATTGELYAFTRLHVGGATARPLGYVDLDDEVRTLADLREDGGTLRPGMRVELVVDGDDWYFRPIATTASGA